MISPAEFVSQVKRELQRVTWPTQKETMGMTVAVILMIIFVMIYFFVTDTFIVWCLTKILGV
ncbi:MAG: preprotein translocase subunit SecE [Alphaproteobacteria bacterium]|nr:preprotein translocase subunit SecE [Alphaproteobacteria bacterium]MCR4555260.1 preprotein translocase subunit SecE [Alphaproteobacteria bacterium]